MFAGHGGISRAMVAAALAVAALSVLPSIATAAAPASARQLTAQVDAARKRANAAAAKLNRATSELARAESEIAKLRSKSAANRKQIDELQVRLKQHAVRQYTSGGQVGVEMGVGDAAQLSRNRFLVRSVTLGSADELDAYRVARSDQALNESALEKRVTERRKVVSRLRGDQAKVSAELASLGKTLKALQAVAPKRASRSGGAPAAAARSGPAALSGSVVVSGAWTCPVQGARAFTNDWGNPRSGGRRHRGTDIFAASGTTVVAPVAGTVSYRNGGLGGLSFYLQGVDGNTYYGAHMARSGASGRVAQGTVVGAVGSSGNASGSSPHLHFELHPGGGAPTNPYPTVRANC